MAFGEQELGAFLDARDNATELLREEGVKRRTVSFEEALIMQAASHVLSDRENFYGLEIAKLVRIEGGSVYPTLNRFEVDYGALTSTYEDADEAAELKRRSRRLFMPTEFGDELFKLFVPES